MADSKKTASIGVRIIGVIIPLLIFVAVSELVLNLFDTDLYFKNQFFPVNRDIDFCDIYKKDPHLFWTFRENITTKSEQFSYLTYHINSHGFRGPEFEKEKKNYRILALGNSCTFGWGVDQDYTWVSQLEKILERQFPDNNCEVINAGIPGYSSHQGKILLKEKLLDLKPDMVLIMFGWNDHFAAGKGISDLEQKMPGRFIIGLQNFFSRFKTYQLMRKIILSASEKQEFVSLGQMEGKRRVSPQEFYVNLAAIAHLARENNAQPVLLVPPIACAQTYFNGTLSQLHVIHQAYQNRIRAVAQKEHIPLIDLQAEFDRYRDLFTDAYGDPTHFNENGHRLTAETIAGQIMPNLASR
ncbi:MAG: SGNH/GDSL hydrolase family protein [candidate division Zixibacteria bacterium]|nr:SGNH/GDSL hydrolase family protein [candidate division Zixibacteria bacterium]